MSATHRVVLVGIGGVNRRVAVQLAGRDGIDVVAAWSRAPDHEGVRLDELAPGAGTDVRVTGRLEDALAVPADVAIIATASQLRNVYDLMRACADRGLNVITTAEEAAQPWAADAALAGELEAVARQRGVTLLGCGVNPGFIFDAMVLTLAGAALHVDRIEVERTVDLGRFSPSVQRRIGLGHTPESFAAGKAAGTITGHVGFPQSMRVVAHAMGRTLQRIDSNIEPTITDVPLAGGTMPIEAGQSGGFVQHYMGWVDDQPWFEARLTGHVDFPATGLVQRDDIWLHGTPDLHLTIDPGLDAQAASTALMANSVRRLVAAPPGWVTIADLPPALPV